MSFYRNNVANINNYAVDATNFVVVEELFTATEGQTVFTVNTAYEINKNRINVYVEGIPQFSPDNFTETSSNSFTLLEEVPLGTKIKAEITQIN